MGRIEGRRKRAHDLIRKRIAGKNPTNIKFIVASMMGYNNWRKMHGIPLMRRDSCKGDRIVMRGFHKKEKYMLKMYDKCMKRESRYYGRKRK